MHVHNTVERAIFGKKKRTIEFRSGSLFDASESFDADIGTQFSLNL